jgi:FlaA1/EpsC-like NDP-sugar epimerase
MIGRAGLSVRSPENLQGDRARVIEIVFTGARPGEQIEESLDYFPAGIVATEPNQDRSRQIPQRRPWQHDSGG